jgi:hypothetical protein
MDGNRRPEARYGPARAVGVIDLVLQIALGVALTAWVVRRDMRRLPPPLYARSWNEASFWSAVVAFYPWSILVHFVRTRRSLWGLLLGLFWVAVVLGTLFLVSAGVEWLGDVPA